MDSIWILLAPLLVLIAFSPTWKRPGLRIDLPSFVALANTQNLVVFLHPNSWFSVKNKISVIYQGRQIFSQFTDISQLDGIKMTKIPLMTPFQE